jgi:N-acylneuraminate cytidylyltransferase
MRSVAVILARAGSKGLPDKCVRPLLGRPVIAYTIDHARASRLLQEIVLTTDSPAAAAIGTEAGIRVVDRPAELATDTARVDATVRHAVEWLEAQCPWRLHEDCSHSLCEPARVDNVVILYGNIPVRADGIVDRCLERLVNTGCSSVRTVAPVTKQHPDWIHRLDGDRMIQFRPNSIHRRQELEPLYYHDGAVIAVTRQALFEAAESSDPHAFFGRDRRAVIEQPEDAVDIDGPLDLYVAEAVLRHRSSGPTQASCGCGNPDVCVP